MVQGQSAAETEAHHMVRDAAMLAAAQALAHYKISRYATLSAWAQKLGLPQAAQLLDETLHEEKDTDEKLGELMISEINVKADNENFDKNDADDKLRRASAPRLEVPKRNAAPEPSSE